MSATKMPTDREVRNAGLRFSTKIDADDLTDAEIRLKIKTLREVLLARQQKRAAAQYVADYNRKHGLARPVVTS